MARYAIVENGVCVNIAQAEANEAQDNFVLLSDEDNVGIGSPYNASTNTWGEVSQNILAGVSDQNIVNMAKQELIDTDWTQLPDVGLTEANVSEWRTHRAILREIKDGIKEVDLHEWPEAPSKEYV
jgi:hypothetical protein